MFKDFFLLLYYFPDQYNQTAVKGYYNISGNSAATKFGVKLRYLGATWENLSSVFPTKRDSNQFP